jgi:hypothetical protein
MTHTLSPQLITDAVVAQYIHDISPRHRVSQSEFEPDRPAAGGPAGDRAQL